MKYIATVLLCLFSASARPEGGDSQARHHSWLWSYFTNRPRIIPEVYDAKEAKFLRPACPTGYPCKADILPEEGTVFTNGLRRESVVPVTFGNLKETLQPGDIIVYSSQGVMKEGGLSAALNGNHHTGLVGLAPDGNLAWTASPKPGNQQNFRWYGEGFHILRFKWPSAMSDTDKQRGAALVQKYFDILYRSDEKSGVTFDYQGDMDIMEKGLLPQFAANLVNAKPGALMKDIYPGGNFNVFCSEAAITAYALALEAMGYQSRWPRSEGLHQGLNLVRRNFLTKKANCTGPHCGDQEIMEKVMKEFFGGTALRVQRNGENGSGSYTKAERREMAAQMLRVIKLGPAAGHTALWALKATGIDWHLGEYFRRAMYATSPYDLVIEPLVSGGHLDYVGTYIGPGVRVRRGELIDTTQPKAIHPSHPRQMDNLARLGLCPFKQFK